METIKIEQKTRTMKFVDVDHWDRPIYRCVETNILYKDLNMGEHEPALYSCQNQWDGEPDSPIKNDIELIFINQCRISPQRFEYMMLDQMRSGCDYFLGWGNGSLTHILENSIHSHIEEMKRIHNLLLVKPEWLTYEQIEEYEINMKKLQDKQKKSI